MTTSARTCTNRRDSIPALLKGLLFGPAGAAFSPTHTRKGDRLYRYYVSQSVLKHGAGACPVGRVPAGEIEAAVINQLRAVFRQPEIVAGTWKAARTHADGITEADARTALQQLDPLCNELFPAEQALLREEIEVLRRKVAEGEDAISAARREAEEHARARESMTAQLAREANERSVWEQLTQETEAEKGSNAAKLGALQAAAEAAPRRDVGPCRARRSGGLEA